MAGLPRKNTMLRDDFIYADGRPKEDSIGHEFFVREKLKAFDEGYRTAKTDLAKQLDDILRPLIMMDFDTYEKATPLSKEFDNVSVYLKCIFNYIKGLRSQINNRNKTNYREGSRSLLMATERLLGMRKGDILNGLLQARESKFIDGRINRKPTIKTTSCKHHEEEIIIDEEDEKEFDPSDALLNNTTN